MRVLGDREIEEMAGQALAADSRVDPHEVSLRVEGGVLYVSGAVDSAAERRAVQEDLEAIAGTVSVVDMLTLRNYVERTNEELAAGVRRALSRDLAVGTTSISVRAEDGVVTLSGGLESHAQKRAAEDVAWWTPGVTDVVNRLRVNGGTEIPEDLQ